MVTNCNEHYLGVTTLERTGQNGDYLVWQNSTIRAKVLLLFPQKNGYYFRTFAGPHWP
jgi:hypothetical protein